MSVNYILCQVLSTGIAKNTRTGNPYYILKILYCDISTSLFFNDKELYEKLQRLERLSEIQLYVDIKPKLDGSFSLTPTGFDM